MVLGGEVSMYYRVEGKEETVTLKVGDIFYASVGTDACRSPGWTCAHPRD